MSSGQSANDVTDVVRHLLLDFGFQTRHRVLRVFKLCYLFVGMPAVKYPVVTFDLSGSAVESRSFQDCLRLVQSHVICSGYSPQSLFGDQTVRAVRRAVADTGVFFVTAGFNLWKNFCKTDIDALAAPNVTLYYTMHFWLNAVKLLMLSIVPAILPIVCLAFALRLKHLVICHVQECGSDVASSTSSVGTVVQKKGTGCSSKSGTTKLLVGSKSDVVVASKKKKSYKKEDEPTVVHKLKKSSKN